MSSSLPTSITAQQKVLGVDTNLLGIVLGYLCPGVKECRDALLVSRLWHMAVDRCVNMACACFRYPVRVPQVPSRSFMVASHALFLFLHFPTTFNSANVWVRILRREYPSMAAPDSLPAPHQQHQLFRRTAKELLSIRITDHYFDLSEAREVARLKDEFRHECIKIIFRHPKHGVVAERRIPIIHQTQGKHHHIQSFKEKYPLALYRVLSASDFERCEVALQMLEGLDLFVYRECMASTVRSIKEYLETRKKTSTGESADTKLCYEFYASFPDTFAANCPGFNQEDEIDDIWSFFLHYDVTCAYPTSLRLRQILQDKDSTALGQILPTAVTATISISADTNDRVLIGL